MRCLTGALLTASCFLVAGGPFSAQAQQLTPVDISGKIAGFGRLAIFVQTEKGDKFIASIDPVRIEDKVQYTGIPQLKINVTGDETAKILQVGMFVRFQANLVGTRKTRSTKDAVSEVSVFTPDKDTVFGLLPNDLGGGDQKPPDDGRRTAPVESFLVVGKITAVRRGSLTVAHPQGTVRARLAPAAVVKLNSGDIRLARVGDRIHVKGYGSRPPRFFATEVTVTRIDQSAARKKPGRPPGQPPKDRPDPFAPKGDEKENPGN